MAAGKFLFTSGTAIINQNNQPGRNLNQGVGPRFFETPAGIGLGFQKAPVQIILALTSFDARGTTTDPFVRVTVRLGQIDPEGAFFTVAVSTTGETEVGGVEISWLAIGEIDGAEDTAPVIVFAPARLT
jgi:hypothetical protein